MLTRRLKELLRYFYWATKLGFKAGPKFFVGYLFLLIIDSAMPALQVFLVGALVDAVGDKGVATNHVFALIIFTTLAFGLNSAVRDAYMTLSQVLTRKISAYSQSNLLSALSSLPLKEISKEETANSARSARDAISSQVASFPSYVFSSSRAVLSTLFILLALSRYNTLAAFIIVVAMFPILYAFIRVGRIESVAWPLMSKHSKFANHYTDLLVYARTAVDLRRMGSASLVARRGGEFFHAAADIFTKSMLRSSAWIIGAGCLTTTLLGLALYVIVSADDVAAGAIAAGIVALVGGVSATSDASYTFGAVLAALPVVKSYREFVECYESDSTSTSSATECLPFSKDAINGMDIDRQSIVNSLDIDNAFFTYPNVAEPALNGINLELKAGEIVALVGLNGAGKTTLVKAITGEIELDAGQISINGSNAATLAEDDRLAMLGVMPQDFGRYEMSIREAMLLGLPGAAAAEKWDMVGVSEALDTEIWAALEQVDMRNVVAALDAGLDTILGEQFGGIGLSGGQWQRIALARIILRKAPIWLLDEPTSSVDPETERMIFGELAKGRDKRITLIASHRASTLIAMDKIYVLENGSIIDAGTYAELISRPGRFKEIFDIDLES